ncbi:hypothetical protein CPC16_005203 [Podila verticillata]|uniref:Uncharacterized protein n=1 Tax=Podila verticillata NRRL 6337 TaxID=1069443 RepID=A0A086TLB9_9FUNG|nr:hypothetical protein BGZ52_002288 [Haplosporangium bisporale]KAF9211296.1 hypothetical protein BGZ59_008288 [Podila verticillata]KAF9390248.1 hypothetical protein CPC16_005203 [Podila verticillata]KAI9240811.1 MAG: hypothetical protein BYD32DRAFT_407448 [Podila humilis]KFH62746.1 hypothetical protein MVEG_11273 [Podila verticillata NRRL 6337]
MANNTSVGAPWTKYLCSATNACVEEGFNCHYGYCIPSLKEGETCVDEKDTVAPFVARIDNVYHFYCDMPTDMKAQNTKCPLGCEVWEDCHSNICFLKKCTQDQLDCKKGNDDACMGVNPKDIMCYNAGIHGASTLKPLAVDEGLTSSQIGGIAGGVSAAVILLAAAGAFFVVRRRRAAKAAKAQAALPTYSSPDEKNTMQQVVSA